MDNFKNKKIIYYSYGKSENMTEQQRHHEKIKEKCPQRGRRCYKENKEKLQKMALDRYWGLSEEKLKEENMLEIDIVIYLKKTNKN